MQESAGAMAAVLQEHLQAFVREVRGARREARLRETLDEVMRIQALFMRDGEAAAGWLRGLGVEAALVETLEPLAIELFQRHRQRMVAIRTGELSRASYVAQQARAAKTKRRPAPGVSTR
jgi:hypothetical protein